MIYINSQTCASLTFELLFEVHATAIYFSLWIDTKLALACKFIRMIFLNSIQAP